MKPNNHTPSWVLPSVVASLTITCAMGQQASTIEWDGANATGNWSDTTWIDVMTQTTRSPVAGDLVGFTGTDAVITIDVNTPLLEQVFIQDNYTLEINEILDIAGTNGVNNEDPVPDIPPTGFFLSNGTVNVNQFALLSVSDEGAFELGRAGSGVLNLFDEGELAIGVNTVFGRDASGSATINQTGGTLTQTGGDCKLSGWGSDFEWNLSGGTAELNTMRFGFGNAGGTGVINHSAGELILKGGNNTIGWECFEGSNFTYNLSGTAKLSVADDRFRLGVVPSEGASCSLIQTGGELSVFGRLDIGDGSKTAPGTSLYSISAGKADIMNSIFVGGFGTTTTGTLEVSGTGELIANDMLIGNGLSGTVNVSGGTVSLFGRLRVGSNNGSTATNQFNLSGGTVTTLNRVDLGQNPTQTNELNVSGGSLSLIGADKRMLIGFFDDGTGIFNLSGTGVVDAEQVVLGDNAGTTVMGTLGTVNLTGGTLITRTIRVGGGDPEAQTLVLDGGTIQVKADLEEAADLISGNVTTASLLAGGVTFDTAGIDASTTAVMTGPGGITKAGEGTLTVNSVQAYTGNTRITGGTLSLMEPYLAETADVYISGSAGAALDLPHGVVDTVRSLYVDGVPVEQGSYDSTASFITSTSTGSLDVMETGGPQGDLEITSITVDGATATIVIQGEPATNYICKSSLNLSGFAPITTTPSPVTTDASGDASFTVDAIEATGFYIVEDAPAP